MFITEIVEKQRILNRDMVKNDILIKFYDKILYNATMGRLDGEIELYYTKRTDTAIAFSTITNMLDTTSYDYDFKKYVTTIEDDYIEEYTITIHYNLILES